jgi:methylenetetrahydrofolate dehydrogenase (NADP+)/methenyltetrahydrofolate cyclohydrolase
MDGVAVFVFGGYLRPHRHCSPVRLLDGSSLARRRRGPIAARAQGVAEARGRAPRLLLVAFADPGPDQAAPPHVGRKLRACAELGVEVAPLILPADIRTPRAVHALHEGLAQDVDGVFLQFPFPRTLDGDELAAAVPVTLDVDVMTPLRIATFMNGLDDLAPVTITAALTLLDAHDVTLRDCTAVVLAEQTPFSLMFRAALLRRGARVEPLLRPRDPRLEPRLADAEIIVVAAAASALVPASALPPASVVIDAGYYNPGGQGDIDTASGIEHLAAFAPVPGGIGPMTVSTLVERVVAFAERDLPPPLTAAPPSPRSPA